MTFDQIANHRGLCELEIVSCPFLDTISCCYKCERRNVGAHAADIQFHYLPLMNSLTEHKRKVKKMESAMHMLQIQSECARLAQDHKYTTGYFSWNGMSSAQFLVGSVKSQPTFIGKHKFSILVGPNAPAVAGFVGLYCCLDTPLVQGSQCFLRARIRIHMINGKGEEVHKDCEVSGEIATNLGISKALSQEELKKWPQLAFEVFLCYEIRITRGST